MKLRGPQLLATFRKTFVETQVNIQTFEKEEFEADYKQKLNRILLPLTELSKIISVYNKRSIPKTTANLWMFFGSNIGRLENTGYVEFIKGLYSIDTYMGTAESEFLVSKADVLPDYTDVLRDIAEPSVEQELIQYGGETTEDGSYSEFYSVAGYEKTAESFLSIPDLDARRQAMQSFLRTVSSQTPDVVEAIDNINAYLAQLPPSNYWLVFTAASNPYSISSGWEHWDGYTTKFVRQFRDPLDFGGHYTVNDNYATTHPSFGDFVRAKKQELTDRINRPLPDIKADFVRLIAQHHELSRGEAKKYHTVVTERKLEGAGKIQAPKMRITDWNMTDRFSLLTDELETVTSGFINTKNIDLPGVKLVFDLLTQDFENTGSIACLELLVRNCGIFRNKSRIDTELDINVTARQVLNVGDPTVTPKSTDTIWHRNFVYQQLRGRNGGQRPFFLDGSSDDFRFLADGGVYQYPSANTCNFYEPGMGLLRSRTGFIKLHGDDLIQNEYSSIMAATGFDLYSPMGTISNIVGNISSSDKNVSRIETRSFEHFCKDAQNIQTGLCRLVWTSCGHYVGERTQPILATFNTSDRSKIFNGGDLHINVSQSQSVKGSDIYSGGSIIGNFPNAYFNVEQVHQLSPVIAATDKIMINGQDLSLKGTTFIAGMEVGLLASGEIVIANPNGNPIIIPPKGAIDINVSEIAQKSYRPMLGYSAMPRMVIDPTAGMRKLFFGCMPDPTKKLVTDPGVLSVLPMILGEYVKLLGTRVLDTPKFLTLLNDNAKGLSNALIPAGQMPNKLLMYFTVKDIDDETQEIDLHINTPAEEFTNALKYMFEIKSEKEKTIIESGRLSLQNAAVSGTSVKMITRIDPKTANADGTISMVGCSTVAATKDNVVIDAEAGMKTRPEVKKKRIYTKNGNEETCIEVMEKVDIPSIQAPKAVVLKGGASELRGTLIKTKTFVDQTLRLLLGVHKEKLNYWSRNEKSGGMFQSDVSIEHRGWQEAGIQTILDIERMLSGQ